MKFSSRQHLEMSRKMAAEGDRSRANLYRTLAKLAAKTEKAKSPARERKSPSLVPKAGANKT